MSVESRVRDLVGKLNPQQRAQLKSAVAKLGVTPAARSNLRGRSAFERSDYSKAIAHAENGLTRRPKQKQLLRLASDVNVRTGDLSSAYAFAQQLSTVDSAPSSWTHSRKIEGRLRETDEYWMPTVESRTPPTAGTSVLYVAKESRPFHDNGFCTRTHETLSSLVSQGTHITCVTMPGFPANVGVSDAAQESRVENVVYRHLLPRAGGLDKDLAYDEYLQLTTQLLAAELYKNPAAMLHVGSGHRGYETALAASAVASWAGIPWIYEVRSFFETTWTADARYRESAEYFYRRLHTETRMMHQANAVVTISGPMRDEIVHQHGVDPDKVYVIPNAVDVKRFAPVSRDKDLANSLDIGEKFVVGYVSNISHPREGQEVLVEAIKLLKDQGRDVIAILVGDGKRRSEIEGIAKRLGVAGRVKFTGNIPFDHVSKYYGLLDLFVVPRIDERAGRLVSPIKPFEAMAMGIPLLMSDLPALVEIAGEQRRAHTFKAGDADDLAREIRSLEDDPAERKRMIESSAQWVKEERDWQKTAESFNSVYASVLAQQAPSS